MWFTNGSSREFAFAVQRDLSVLERALKRVHPSIEVESAPDRDALVLTGLVPDINASLTAEAIARNYLDAGNGERGTPQPLIAAPPDAAGAVHLEHRRCAQPHRERSRARQLRRQRASSRVPFSRRAR